jgi:hypothetical protein
MLEAVEAVLLLVPVLLLVESVVEAQEVVVVQPFHKLELQTLVAVEAVVDTTNIMA